MSQPRIRTRQQSRTESLVPFLLALIVVALVVFGFLHYVAPLLHASAATFPSGQWVSQP